jgi:hypothetical protein
MAFHKEVSSFDVRRCRAESDTFGRTGQMRVVHCRARKSNASWWRTVGVILRVSGISCGGNFEAFKLGNTNVVHNVM